MTSQKKWETDANLFCEYSKTGDKNIQELAELLKDLRETNKKLAGGTRKWILRR